VDYFDSLYESLTYRKSRTVELRVVAEIGLEVLLAIATVGVGTAIRLAANTAKAAKAASAVRIGPFPALAITQMVDLSQSLQKAAAMRAVPNIPPVKPLEIPDYGKAKPGGPMATPLKTEKPDTGDDSAGGAKTLPERKVIELEPGQKGSWNKTLNGKLEPNTNYKVGNKTYETDEHARVSRVSGELKPTKNDRNTYQQGKAGKESGIKDGYKDDEGGHIISSRHDGAGEQINYVPMNSHGSRWRINGIMRCKKEKKLKWISSRFMMVQVSGLKHLKFSIGLMAAFMRPFLKTYQGGKLR